MNCTSTTTPRPMVIIGAGHAGGRAAQALREFGWSGPIVMVGAEAHAPYERPPLSKGLLTGEQAPEACLLRPLAQQEAEQISQVQAWVEAIDPAAREIVIASRNLPGRRIAYEALLLATGGHVRRLSIPGADSPGVLALRTLDDAAALAPRLQPGARVLIVGGGFIGLEVAASARARGCAVTLLEGAPRLLGRAVPPAIGARVAALHHAQGVDLRLGTVPQAIERLADGRFQVALEGGAALRADTVVVGVGIEPAVDLARAAGLAVGRGVRVDAHLATSDPHIFAAGDVAEFPSAFNGAPIRQETWHNAETQARVAAANMLGRGESYDATPWFWSDQYDHQVQVAGEPALGTEVVNRPLADGALIDGHFDADGRLVGVSGFGPVSALAREFKLARLLVERRRPVTPAQFSDPATKLKPLV